MVNYNTNFYLLRNTYQKIQEFNKEYLKNKIILNTIVWEKDIFLSNKDDLLVLKKQNNWTLYELEYKNYKLFFILEINSAKHLCNVFWVNILKSGTIYENYKNESIISFKLGDQDNNYKIYLNNKMYTVAHVGNSLTSYAKKYKYPLSREVVFLFEAEVKKYLHGIPVGYKFKSSFFNDYIIIYGHDY